MTTMPRTRILFVDDEPNVLDGMRRSFRGMRRQWELFFAAGGTEALDLMSRQTVDVIVTDMRMPGMDGLQLLEAVKKRHPSVVRIILSGQTEQEASLRTVKTAHQYLSKPCEPEALKTALLKIAKIGKSERHASVKALVGRMSVVPSLPSLYGEIMAELENPKTSVRRVGDIIAKDIGMTAQILKIVNSSFFGFYKKITDPGQAVGLLGLETIQTLVLTVQFFSEASPAVKKTLSMRRLWEHSHAAAVYARAIVQSETDDMAEASGAFLCGMLHDMGKLVLADNFPEQYRTVLAEAGRGRSLADLETERFHVSHADVGGYLLGLWGISDAIVDAIVRHHDPAEAGVSRVAAALWGANIVDHALRADREAADADAYLRAEAEGEDGIARLSNWRGLCAALER